jgi:hypothetical protein
VSLGDTSTERRDVWADREKPVTLALIGLIALGAATTTLLATTHGPTVTVDSISYFRMADRLPPLDHPPGHFPEGYPIVLAALQHLGLGLIDAARWLGVALTAVNVVLAGLVARRMAGGWWAVLVAAALATSAVVEPLSTGAVTEPLFFTLVLAWLLLVDSQSPIVVTTAGVAATGAAYVRYAGVAIVVAGVLTLWRDRDRLRAFVVGAGGSLIAWALARVALGSETVRELAWHPPSSQMVRNGIADAEVWVTGHSGSTLTGSIVLIGSTLLLWRARRVPGGHAVAAAAASYAVVLALTVTLFDAQTPLNGRLLAPLLVLVLLSLPALSTMPASRWLALGVVFAVLLNANVTRDTVRSLGTGLLTSTQKPTVVAARHLDGAIASNGPGVIWLATGKEVRAIPSATNPWTEEPAHDLATEMNRLRDQLRGGGHLVWLDAFDYRLYLPTEAETVRDLGAVLVQRFPDGAIYVVGS